MKIGSRLSWGLVGFALLLVCALAGFAFASDDGSIDEAMTEPPGGEYQKVSDLVPLPEFIPGMGTLYVQPGTLPFGPFLGYDRDGKLVQITYMVPIDDLVQMNNITNLATLEQGFNVDHVDITYNPGHPGVEAPHYHITLWGIPADAESSLQ